MVDVVALAGLGKADGMTQDERGRDGSSRTRRHPRRFGALALAALLLAPLLAVAAGPASPAAAVEPQPIPADLWDIAPAVGSGVSYIALEGDVGEHVSGGGSHLYTKANSTLTVTQMSAVLRVDVDGDERWDGWVQLPDSSSLQVGFYALSSSVWSGEGRGCGSSPSVWLAVDEVQRSGSSIDALTMRFGQTCGGSQAELRGKVLWNSSDPTAPPGPTTIPGGLWDVHPAVEPGQSYLVMTGPVGNGITDGVDRLITSADAEMHISSSERYAGGIVEGDDDWELTFYGPSSMSSMTTGYYGNVGSYLDFNLARPRADLGLGEPSCDDLSGWFAIDEISFAAGALSSITLRFEARCGVGPAAHGKLHWNSSDSTLPPGPTVPVPDGLWDVNPAVGPGQSFVALESSPGYPTFEGSSELHTKATSSLSVSESSGSIRVAVDAGRDSSGQFRAMPPYTSLEVGFYDDAREMSGNPTRPGVSWSAHQNCSTTGGWLAIDEIQRTPQGIAALSMRFEKHCGSEVLRGKVRWLASDPTVAPGPVTPVPDGLWDIEPDVAPGQSYVALESEEGDPFAHGASELYTKADATLSVAETSKGIHLSVAGDENWQGTFIPMSSRGEIEPGHYADIVGTNPAKGRVAWSGSAGSCHVDPESGWFAVDELTRSEGTIETATIRFELSCGGAPPLHGKVRWNRSDPTVVPGPRSPVPDGLWDTHPEVGPDQSYVTLSAPVGEPLSGGIDTTFTKADSNISVVETGGRLNVVVDDGTTWTGTFVPMSSLTALEPGYYPDSVLAPAKNPRRSSLSWSRFPPRCSAPSGWFAVDEMTRSAGTVDTATIRFGLTCDGVSTLNGKVHWNADDPTVPTGPELPVPDGLWNVVPDGVEGEDYVFIDGVDGDPITGGVDSVIKFSEHGFGASDHDGTIAALVQVAPGEGWVMEFDGTEAHGLVGPGYYGGLSSDTSPSPVKGGVSIRYIVSGVGFRSCPAPQTGWFAVDKVTRIDGDIAQLDLRFEQSCNGAPPLHGRIHIDWGGLPAGPPVGAVDSMLLQPGGVKVDGWALDPETAASIDVGFTVDGTEVSAVVADQQRNGIPAPYGPAHGFTSTVPVPPGAHELCAVARNTGAGSDTELGCRTFLVPSASSVNPQPIPDDLWDVVPDGVSGDYLYIEGADGDPVTTGEDTLIEYAGESFLVTDQPERELDVMVNVEPDDAWVLAFRGVAPGTLSEPGYYSDLWSTTTAANPDVAGLNILNMADGQCLITRTGWFAIDRITRIDGVVTQLDARFAQSCNGAPPLHGRIHIDRGGLPAGPPIGSVESMTLMSSGVNVEGWVFDPETAAPIDVTYTIDGSPVSTQLANGSRPDVAAIPAANGDDHGLFHFVPVPRGTHRVCAIAKNVGVGADTSIGCQTVTIATGSPIGSVDTVRAVPGAVNVAGWALDPDTGAAIPVHVYVGTKGVALSAIEHRPDVGAVYPGYGPNHGFSTGIPTGPGTHQVCAYAINVGGGSNTLLGCRSVTVPSGPPIGSLDVAKGVPGGVDVSGWAIDPDTAEAIPVHVYVGSKGVPLTANGNRPDVGAYFGPYGPAHGFSTTISAPPGVHQVCAYGINTGVGATSVLGCRTVVVPGGSPFGSLDVVSGGAGNVTVSGWAIDPDTSAPISVHVYVGNVGTALTAGGNRPDVAAVYPGYGSAHGFDATLDSSPGAKQVCAYAINTSVGATTLLGCRTVTIT